MSRGDSFGTPPSIQPRQSRRALPSCQYNERMAYLLRLSLRNPEVSPNDGTVSYKVELQGPRGTSTVTVSLSQDGELVTIKDDLSRHGYVTAFRNLVLAPFGNIAFGTN